MKASQDVRGRSPEIREFLVGEIARGNGNPVAAAVKSFGISPQAVNRHLRVLTEQGVVLPVGATSGRTYVLRARGAASTYPLDGSLEESRVWREFVRPQLDDVPERALEICHYGVTEMVNNAIDHSEGTAVRLEVSRSAADIAIDVRDDGVGIFQKIRNTLGLADEQEAVLELSKGKLTSDPDRHTGEGIFFTSRMFDQFSILSGAFFFSHVPAEEWLLESREPAAGTLVQMVIDPNAPQTVTEVFDRYASADGDYKFAATHVPVFLARLGEENLVSRSQAKRLVARLDRFDQVILDFAGVNAVGQAFADEVFRVFQGEHPDVRLSVTNAAPAVERMIRRAVAAGTGSGPDWVGPDQPRS